MQARNWIVSAAALGLVACGSSSSGVADPEETIFGTMTAVVNGQPFEVTYAYTAPGGGGRQVNGLSCPTPCNPQSFIGVTLAPFSGTGTYTLGEDTNHDFMGNIPGVGFFHSELGPYGGTVVVTSDSPRLRGTFSFTGSRISATGDVVTVTDGEFDVPRVR